MTIQPNPRSWYRHFWPWFSIALLASAVAASVVTLLIAVQSPHQLVISEAEYEQVQHQLRALDRDE